MATHSSIVAWRIPQTKESARLQSMGSQKVRHDWETKQQKEGEKEEEKEEKKEKDISTDTDIFDDIAIKEGKEE